jgi:hypothetical protein
MVRYNSHMPRGGKNQKLTQAQIDEIVRRYTTRLPDGTWEGTPTLARDFGVSIPTVKRWLGLNGVTLRSRKESHAGGKRCKPVKNLPPGLTQPPSSAERLLALPGAPSCKCGCGENVLWNRRKNKWNVYVIGHYRQDAPYKNEAWLREQHVGQHRGIADIARECGVREAVIAKFRDKFQIPRQPVDHSKQGSPGPRNPAWKGGVAQWPYSPDWKALARQIRDRDKWTCQDCGECRVKWGIHLHVHHIDGNKLNNDPENLISLCAKCHRKRHVAGNLGEVETGAA